MKTFPIVCLLTAGLIFFAATGSQANLDLYTTAPYLNLIQQRVNSQIFYPPQASINNWQGIVKIKFTIDNYGRVKKIDVAESSGYPLLDAVAMISVQNAAPYPFPKELTGQNELELILPINFAKPAAAKTTDFKMSPTPRRAENGQGLSSLSKARSGGHERNMDFSANQSVTSNRDGFLPSHYRESSRQVETNLSDQAAYLPLAETAADTKPFFQPIPDYPSPASVNNIKPPEKIPAQHSPAYLFSETIPSFRETPKLTPKPDNLIQQQLGPQSEELRDLILLALDNNQPSQVAREEVELAQLKVDEAKRNLFPALKLMSYYTNGEVYKVDYWEREHKIQLDQPIYYGYRLKNAVEQAQVNLLITRRNYDRLTLDVIHKTETSYYNLIAARMNLEQKQNILTESQQVLDKINKLHDGGMVIPLELATAKNWNEQIRFQIAGLKQELFMANLAFKQVLNIKDLPEFEAKELPVKKLDLSLDQCVKAGLLHRPEIYLSELTVKYNEFGEKIEKGKNSFTVDLTGSYGKYSGAYKTESGKDSDNWYVGLKVNKPWGANTINTSLTKEETQPKFGQTSPTASATVSTEFSLWDNKKRISDEKRTQIDLHRSISDLNETAKTIAFEIQDAFLNYQKSVLQLDTAESEMKFRRKEADMVKIRAMVGETALSSVNEILYNYSEAQNRYIQALANYYISLANLKKACGYGIK